jgi:hypothetical protein
MRFGFPGPTGPFLEPRPERSGGLGQHRNIAFDPGPTGPFRDVSRVAIERERAFQAPEIMNQLTS